MGEVIKSKMNEYPPVWANDDSSAKLSGSSKNARNARLSWDMGSPELMNEDIAKTSSLRDVNVRRSLATLWDVKEGTISEGVDIKVYKRRWFLLFMFVLFSFVGTYQWTMFTIIANVITKYYNISNRAVDFTALSYLIIYLVTFLPAGWVLNSMGMRWAMLTSCFLHALGCVLRLFAVPSDRFWLVMIAQCIVGLSQVFFCLIPARLAAVWFPAHQVSFACAFSLNGFMVGHAAGFLVPPLLVRNSDNLGDIAADLNSVYIALATSALLSLALTAAFFQEEPPLPPSQAEKVKRTRRNEQKSSESPKEFLGSIKRLLTKRTYMTLLISYSFINSVSCVLATLMNQILISHFPGSEKEIGVFGLLLVAPGIISAGGSGYVLDRTHAFKTTTMVLYLVALIGWIAFAVLLRYGNMTWMYISSAILGFAMGGVWPVGMEFGVEITFPEPEGTTTGLLSAALQSFQVLSTLLYVYILETWKEDIANAVFTVILAIACLMLCFLRPKLKRQAAQRVKSPEQLGDIGC